MVGCDFWSKVALGTGYRYLFVNYEDNAFLFDQKLRGLGLGATIHWWGRRGARADVGRGNGGGRAGFDGPCGA
jgi:hypothetical protein